MIFIPYYILYIHITFKLTFLSITKKCCFFSSVKTFRNKEKVTSEFLCLLEKKKIEMKINKKKIIFTMDNYKLLIMVIKYLSSGMS